MRTRAGLSSSIFKQTRHHRDGARPTVLLGGQLLASRAGNRIEPRAAVVLARAPLALDPPFLLQPQERRVDRPLIERERTLSELLDSPRDAVTMPRPHRL